MKRWFFCLLLIPLLSLQTPAENDLPLQANLVQLMANPEKYAGKRVSVIGFLWLSREQDALFLGAEDFRHGVIDNSIGIRMSPELRKKSTAVNLAYVVVVGTFAVSREGLLSGFQSGVIEEVRDVRLWSTLSKPRFETELPPKPCFE